MKKLINIALLIFGLIIFGYSINDVKAQESSEYPARYAVSFGDTLSDIAERFGISLQALINANDLADPNQLSANDVLNLPNIDWISGLIISREVTFGESISSLSISHRIDKSDLARLNRISSPAQMFVSAPLLLATERGENIEMGRISIPSQESLLEIALRTGGNQWAILESNYLRTAAEVISGELLYLPQIEQAGPGLLPSPISKINIGNDKFIQGEANGVSVDLVASLEASIDSLHIELDDVIFNLYVDQAGNMSGVLGTHTLTEPGFYEMTLSGLTGDGFTFSHSQTVIIGEGGYGFETITVDESLLDPTISNNELNFIATIVDEYTPNKMWFGYFVSPTPFGEDINSFFGTRRSYNGSPFDYYHSGVDFGGGLGTQIFAAAAGVVVQASQLEVRGYATIINHGWGIYSGYFHQSELLVNVGDRVAAGQVIGIVGNTGRSSGSHLHWEMWVGGVQVDPLDWLLKVFP